MRGSINLRQFCLSNALDPLYPMLSLSDMVAHGWLPPAYEISHSSIRSTLDSETVFAPRYSSVDTRPCVFSFSPQKFGHISCIVSFHETSEHIIASSNSHNSGCAAIRSTREDNHLANMAPTRPIQITKNPDSNHFFLWLSFLARSELDRIVFPQVSAVRVTRLQAWMAGRGTL